jgi:hypothetical protein
MKQKTSNNFESRTARFNLPVRHPSKWSVLVDHVLASPMRLHRLQDLNRRIAEDAIREEYCGGHE